MDKLIILDFGAQYGQLIARRIREANVYCEVRPGDLPVQELRELNPAGLILTGGPKSVYDEVTILPDPGVFELGVPVLGICYGMQAMMHQLGGQVEPAENREYGRAELNLQPAAGSLLAGCPPTFTVWMSHGDLVQQVAPGFEITASTPSTPAAAVANVRRQLYGVQFHPEVQHTEHGQAMLENFVYKVCGLEPAWTMRSFVERTVPVIREQVGEERLICGLSGGIDSSVAAALVHRAVGDQLTCIFVDHGLLRQDEAQQVVHTFQDTFSMNLVHVDARRRFLDKLEGVTDPETKRKIIGREFIRVFEEEARKLGPVRYLVQGTTYPDVIESGTQHAEVIKSHHNVGGLPEDMELEVLEPVRDLFKDEVRAVAQELDFPEDLTWRQPFPGPGLALRVIGEITPERLAMVRHADAIVRQEIARAGLQRSIWQSFAVLPGVRSVGVMGDQRTYEQAIVIRAVTSSDGMTADWARVPHELMETWTRRITGEVEGINRVLYDITSKPPGTIEWE